MACPLPPDMADTCKKELMLLDHSGRQETGTVEGVTGKEIPPVHRQEGFPNLMTYQLCDLG